MDFESQLEDSKKTEERLEIDSPGVAIPPTIYRAPKHGFPQTAAETAAETAGENRGAGGSAGGAAAETARKSAVSLLLRAGGVPAAVSTAVPPALPPTPRVSLAVSAAISATVWGNPGLGALMVLGIDSPGGQLVVGSSPQSTSRREGCS